MEYAFNYKANGMDIGSDEELGPIVQFIRHLHNDIDWNVFIIERRIWGLEFLLLDQRKERFERCRKNMSTAEGKQSSQNKNR